MACGSACSVLLGCCCAFSPNFYVFIALRFLIGACTVSILISLSVYTVEIVGQEWRPFVGLQFGVFSGVGYMYLALLGYFLRHWRHLQLALSCSFLPFLFFAHFLPESPRLLFARGEIARGKRVCRRMSERNGNRKFNKGIWIKAEIVEDCAKTYSPRELFEEKSLLRLLLSSTVLYFVNSLVFFCLSFNVGAWSGSPFLNQFLSGLVESVACVAFVPVVSRLGRRWTNVVCLLLAGCLMIAIELLKLLLPARDWVYSLETGILLIAKFCISGSFNMLFMYIAELFPTHLRNTATGVASAGARLASVISPFLIMIHSNFHWIFAVVLGLLSIATSVLAHFCPETKGIPMFATTRDAINFYKYGKAAKPCSISSNNGPDALNNNRTDFVTSLIIDDDDGDQSTGLSDDKSSTERSSQYDEKDAMI